MILVHNHPSGTNAPSLSDINATKRLKEVSDLVGIHLVDHVIVTKKGYYSFKEASML
jgi:DNA repair protein RadC